MTRLTRRGLFKLLAGAAGAAVAPKPLLALAAPEGFAFGPYDGLLYWHVNANTGTCAGIDRSTWPGRLSTPVINPHGEQLTVNAVKRAHRLLARSYE